MTPPSLRLVFDPAGSELVAAQQCEADVFLQTYGNTPEQFEQEYGPYDAVTHYMVVLEPDGRAAATARFIVPGDSGLKTLNDVSRPPWQVDGLDSARSAGVDPSHTWDIATIAVRPGAGRGGLCSGALYHGLITAACANGMNFIVMVMDTHARELLLAMSVPIEPLPGTGSGEYLGSPDSTPLYARLDTGLEHMRQENPAAHALVVHGAGLDDVELPTDWVLRS